MQNRLVFAVLAGLLALGIPSRAVQAQAAAGLDPALIEQLSTEDRQNALKLLRADRQERSGEESVPAAMTPDDARTRKLGDPLPRRTMELEGLPLFGYALFAKADNAFQASAEVPISDSYVLGPSDVVRVQLFGNQNETLNLPITRDGAINFPKLGPVQVAGLSLVEARAVIERRVAKELIGVQTNITLGRLRGMQVFLLGDARQPGAYSVSGLATITNALIAGGGVAETGSLRKIELKRGGRTVQTLDLYDFLLRGDASRDVRLQSGDAVFIPPVGARVAVAGAVTRPAVYEVSEGLTVRAAVQLAGGLTGNARRAQVSLTRVGPGGERQLRELNLGDESAWSVTLRNGDRLEIAAVYERADNPVSVLGHVRYEKSFAWSAGLKLSRLLALAEVRPSEPGRELYSALALIERTQPDSGLRVWRGFDLAAVRSGAFDESVEPMDRVLVLTRADVAYLLASEVRNALKGELPRPVTEFAASEQALTAEEGRPQDDVQDASNTPRDAPEGAVRGERPVLASSSARTARGVKRTAEVCPALLEVVKMSDSARATSIRVLLEGQASAAENRFSQAVNAGRQQAARLVAPTDNAPTPGEPCPRVFQVAPTVLPYLLEHSAGLAGEIRQPGLYPFVDGTSIGRLLAMAGGETAEASKVEVEFFNAADVTAAETARFRRLPRDDGFSALKAQAAIYRFLPSASLPEVGAITIRGEVRFPGRYVVARGERYSELLARAGGLNESAFVEGTVFTRVSAREQEMAANRRAAADLRESLVNAATQGLSTQASSNASNAAVLDLVQRLESAPVAGRVVIEADPATLSARPETDFLLEPGDEIVVPKRPNSVAVMGQVLSPGSLAFVSGGSAQDYIRQSGGFAQGADEKRAFIVLPNGVAKPLRRSFGWTDRSEVTPGSVIVVPRDVSPFTGLVLTERITGILSNLALSVAALVTINR